MLHLPASLTPGGAQFRNLVRHLSIGRTQQMVYALNQATRELIQRFDFKDTNTTMVLKEEAFLIESADEQKSPLSSLFEQPLDLRA